MTPLPILLFKRCYQRRQGSFITSPRWETRRPPRPPVSEPPRTTRTAPRGRGRGQVAPGCRGSATRCPAPPARPPCRRTCPGRGSRSAPANSVQTDEAQTTDSRQQTADSRKQTADSRQQTTDNSGVPLFLTDVRL